MDSKKIIIGLLGVAVILLVALMVMKDGDSESSSSEPNNAAVEGQDSHDHSQDNPLNAEPVVEDNTPKTSIEFPVTEHAFGTIAQNQKVRHIFKFKNTGDNPLIITNARGSCGCTVPKWPREAIAPGSEGEIEVEFSSGQKSGLQNKTVTITANTEPKDNIIKISAEVDPEMKVES